MSTPYVCSAKYSGGLDNGFRRFLHKPEKILSPFIREGMTVIDMGCGPGHFTLGIARLVGESGRVIAADLQQEMLDKMLLKITAAGLEKRVTAHKCGQTSTGIKSKADFILCFWMVHEVPDQVSFLAEMKSILNPDGTLFICEPKFHVTAREFDNTITLLLSAGFRITETPKVAISRTIVAVL